MPPNSGLPVLWRRHSARLGLPRRAHAASNFAVRCATNDRGASIMIKAFAVTTVAILLSGSPASAQTIYPIDRAEILAGAQFDFKVEFPDRVDPAKLKVTVNGADHSAAFGQSGNFVDREDDKDQSSLILRNVVLSKPGSVRSRSATVRAAAASSGRSTIPGRGRRRTSSCSSATGCRPRIGSPRASSPRGSLKARAAASLPSTTCRTWRWSPPLALIRSSRIRRTPPAPMPPATRPPSMRWGSTPIAPQVRSTIPGSKP